MDTQINVVDAPSTLSTKCCNEGDVPTHTVGPIYIQYKTCKNLCGSKLPTWLSQYYSNLTGVPCSVFDKLKDSMDHIVELKWYHNRMYNGYLMPGSQLSVKDDKLYATVIEAVDNSLTMYKILLSELITRNRHLFGYDLMKSVSYPPHLPLQVTKKWHIQLLNSYRDSD